MNHIDIDIDISVAEVLVNTVDRESREIEGKWLHLSNFLSLNELESHCEDLFYEEGPDEDEEKNRSLIYTDWHEIPEGMIGRDFLEGNLFDYIYEVSSLDSRDEARAFWTWIDINNIDIRNYDAQRAVERFREDFIGEYRKEEDFAEEVLNERGDIPDDISYYIDYEKFANDLFISDYTYKNGYVFINN
jgi:putative anti-restriction protein